MEISLRLHSLAEQLLEAMRDNMTGDAEGACRRAKSVALELAEMTKGKAL